MSLEFGIPTATLYFVSNKAFKLEMIAVLCVCEEEPEKEPLQSQEASLKKCTVLDENTLVLWVHLHKVKRNLLKV